MSVSFLNVTQHPHLREYDASSSPKALCLHSYFMFPPHLDFKPLKGKDPMVL